MSYRSMQDFINSLRKEGELYTISHPVSPELQMTEITDRLSKNHDKAVLFTNTGTQFPVLMNAFGSEKRILKALNLSSWDEFETIVEELTSLLISVPGGLSGKMSLLKTFKRLRNAVPVHKKGRGACQEFVMPIPDLNRIPILQCWPYDGGRFITLPMVHTKDPETGMVNVGMYRMQIFDSSTTGMHWHRHKGGAAHFEKYKSQGRRMPVVVTLGGDPSYTYAASAPLPDMISEYALAGFLRQKRITLVKCFTCDIEVPEDVDFVIEGYIDRKEDYRTEGPFGDHTGFYSLPDEYPVFHVTCITHRKDAVYPATIVGIPPMEDAYLGKATERLFFPLIKRMIIPELEDMYLPVEGGFHNLAILSIRKNYPGQAIKVMNAVWSAGQMMFVKNIIITDFDVDIRDPLAVMNAIGRHTYFPEKFHFMRGPLDALDHAVIKPSFGRKMGIDATAGYREEVDQYTSGETVVEVSQLLSQYKFITDVDTTFTETGNGILIVHLDTAKAPPIHDFHETLVKQHGIGAPFVLFMDHTTCSMDYTELLWLFLASFNPETDLIVTRHREHYYLAFDGTIKAHGKNNAQKIIPNVITMDHKTIADVDEMWNKLQVDSFFPSPSLKYKKITLSEGYLFEK